MQVPHRCHESVIQISRRRHVNVSRMSLMFFRCIGRFTQVSRRFHAGITQISHWYPECVTHFHAFVTHLARRCRAGFTQVQHRYQQVSCGVTRYHLGVTQVLSRCHKALHVRITTQFMTDCDAWSYQTSRKLFSSRCLSCV